MRKLFTLDDLVIALDAAVGYGFSFEIPKILGCPVWPCIIICLVVGTAPEEPAHKIVFSETVQTKPAYRFTAFAVLVVIFLLQCKSPRRWACPYSIMWRNSSNSS